jgi:hypothetical protein
VHDIGKVGLQPGLLEKAGALTLEERRKMEAHPVIGERILAKVDGYEESLASSGTITRGSTAMVTLTASLARRSRSCRESSRSPMRITP